MTYQEDRGEGVIWRQRLTFLTLLLLLIVIVSGSFLWATDTPGTSFSGELSAAHDPSTAERLRNHVEELATSPRNLQKPASIVASIGYLEEQLGALGYRVQRQEVLSPADNLMVILPGKRRDASILIVGAHYDSYGAAPGADDNASGVAAILEIARVLRQRQFECEIQLVLWANEEPPYFKSSAMGSVVHASSLPENREVLGAISLESIGYFDPSGGSQKYPFPFSVRYPDTGNFIAFVGDLSSRTFLRRSIGDFRKSARIPSVGGTAPGFVQGIDWSDHWAYSQLGVPALMITDTAPFRNPNYHQTSDLPATLDFKRMARVTEGVESMITHLASHPAECQTS